MDYGFIYIHRKILDWEWYKDINTKVLFFHILIKANFKDKKWKGEIIKRGQLLTSIQNLSKETSLSSQQVRTALKKLEKTQEITINSTNKFTLLTIENYDEYQNKEENATNNLTNKQQTNNKQITNKQQTNNKQITTTNKDNKDNKENKDNKDNKDNKKSKEQFSENEKLNQTIINFIEMRKSIKAKMTDNAIKLMLSKLEKMTNSDDEKILILEQSIMNSWKGIFELRTQNKVKIINNEESPAARQLREIREMELKDAEII